MQGCGWVPGAKWKRQLLVAAMITNTNTWLPAASTLDKLAPGAVVPPPHPSYASGQGSTIPGVSLNLGYHAGGQERSMVKAKPEVRSQGVQSTMYRHVCTGMFRIQALHMPVY